MVEKKAKIKHRRTLKPKPYANARPMGRPKVWTDEAIEIERQALEDYMMKENGLWFEGFMARRGYSKANVFDWAQRFPRFKDTFELCKRIQEEKLVTRALNKKYDSAFTRFVLANRAGWRERIEMAGDPQAPLLGILQGIDGTSKQIINVEPEQIEQQPSAETCKSKSETPNIDAQGD